MEPIVYTKTVAGLSSCVEVVYSKKIKFLIDCGPIYRKNLFSYGVIFITHCHLDHCLNVFFIARQRAQQNLPKPTVYLPKNSMKQFETVRKSLSLLDGSELELDLVGLELKEEKSKTVNLFKNKIEFTYFATSHRVPSLGYSFKSKFNDCESNDVIVTGDTTSKVFENDELDLDWKEIIIECTYLGENQETLAEKGGHLCLKNIIDNISSFKQAKKVRLVHFSERYSVGRILEELNILPKYIHSKVYPDISLLKYPKDMARVVDPSLKNLLEAYKAKLSTDA